MSVAGREMGEMIFEGHIRRMSARGLVLLGIGTAVLGILFLFLSRYLLSSGYPGEFEAGIASIVVGVVLMPLSCNAFYKTRTAGQVLRTVRFFENGISVEDGQGYSFGNYDKLRVIRVIISNVPEDQAAASTLSLVFGVLIGNWTRVGAAIAGINSAGKTFSSVHFSIGNESTQTSENMSKDQAMKIGGVASRMRRESVTVIDGVLVPLSKFDGGTI